MPPHSTHGRHHVNHGLAPLIGTDEPLPIDGNVYRDHGLGLKSGLIGKDRLLADRASEQLALPGYPLARR
jgi:hypothetical protein